MIKFRFRIGGSFFYAEHPQEFVDSLLAEADEWWTSRTPVERAADLGTFAGAQGAEAGMMWGAGKVARVALVAPSALKALKLRRAAAASKARTFDFDDMEAFSKAANDPMSGATYRFNGITWKTDRLGRVESVEGRFRHMPASRDKTRQRRIGYNGPETDVGFHLWPADARGPANMLNVTPGNGKPLPGGIKNLNNSKRAKFEKEVMDLAKIPGNKVEVRIVPRYTESNSSRRPNLIFTQYKVNGGAWSRTQQHSNLYLGVDGNVTNR